MSQSQRIERTGGQLVVDALLTHEVDTVFCVPGESYLAVLDALHDHSNAIRAITCRQEGGAAFMAEAYGKATGKPGVLLVTRGPGACNASIGVHTALQDSTPMVVLIGQVARDQAYREAFQEIDYRQFYAPLCKWVAQVESADRLPELMSQAFHRATAGRPGPVALALPEDMLRELAPAGTTHVHAVTEPEMSETQTDLLRGALAKAKRPFMLVGGPGFSAPVCEALQNFAAANHLPVGASFRCQDRFDNTHACYAGDVGIGVNPKLAQRLRDSDLLVVVGARLGEMTTQGYTLPEPPRAPQPLVHVYPDPDELGRVYQPDLPICASTGAFARAVAHMPPIENPPWAEATRQAHTEYLEWIKPEGGQPGDVDMGAVMQALRDALPPEAILTTDAGNFSGWMHRHYVYRRYPSQLGPTNGAMGYGVPAAIAAKLAYPDRPVVGFCGDGGALMSGQEIATAVHESISPIILVINNGMYGTIRMHQEREYPGRLSSTSLTNPDFAAWARSFGAHGETVKSTEEFAPALERSLRAGKVAVIELQLDPEVINTRTTLSAIRSASSKA